MSKKATNNEVSKNLPRSSPGTDAYMEDERFLFNLIRQVCPIDQSIKSKYSNFSASAANGEAFYQILTSNARCDRPSRIVRISHEGTAGRLSGYASRQKTTAQKGPFE
jgi:hypothetical protein